jgi:RNA polymerase sigma factor for flagellar operon FliA
MENCSAEEDAMWRRFHATRDDRSRTWLIEHYAPLVDTAVRGFRNVRPQDREDLRGAGYLGLVRSVDQWEPERKPWLLFARFRIRAAMVDHIRESSWVGKSIRQEVRRLERAEEALTAELHGRRPTDEELAVHLGMAVDDLAGIRSRIQGTEWALASLDYMAEGQDASWEEALADPMAVIPEEETVRQERAEVLASVLDRMPARLRDVLVSVYLEGEKMQDVARRYGVHPSRVSQLEIEALAMARALAFERPLEVG